MNVVYVASEVFPFFKTGGLADVMYSLPRKMSRIGHDVSVIMPKYSQISQIYTDLETYSVFGMTQILSDEKNLRHLRNLRA